MRARSSEFTEWVEVLRGAVVAVMRRFVPEPRVTDEAVLRLYDACGRDAERMSVLVAEFCESPMGAASRYDLYALLADGQAFAQILRRADISIAERRAAISRSEALRKAIRQVEEERRSMNLLARAHMAEAGFDARDPIRREAVFEFAQFHLGVSLTDLAPAFGGGPDVRSRCFFCRCAWHIDLYSQDDDGREIIRCACGQVFIDRASMEEHVIRLRQA